MKASFPIHHILYKTTNLINNKIYVGVHSTSNLDDGYHGSGKVIKRAIAKYGKENFKREILQEFNTREEALAEEAKIVDGDFIRRKDTYNANVGGGHNWYGMVTVKDKDGNIFQVAKDDPRWLCGEFSHMNVGMITAVDKNGNKIKVSKDDPRYLSREVTGHTIGLTAYIDLNGNTILISPSDHRVKSGEFTHVAKGRITAKDKDGNILSINVGDPRIKTGELVGVMKGHKHKIVTCPWCQKEGSLAGLGSTHFDYCHKNPNRKHRKEWKTVICPHCGKKGKPSPMSRWHFDNCKMKS